jgi:glycerol-3-phosphate acyltransferase PlsY
MPAVPPTADPDPAALERTPSPRWLTEARRKALHFMFILLPLELLYTWLPWPRGRSEWRWCLIVLTLTAITLDVIRIHDHRVRRFFTRFVGELLRDHESFSLLGSTYLLIAALLAVEIFTLPVAAAALGFTILGDGVAALVGRRFGRNRFFGKTLEGAAGGLGACLIWATYLATIGALPWNVVLVGALVASLIELLPIPLDDNLGITLFAGYAMKLLWSPA